MVEIPKLYRIIIAIIVVLLIVAILVTCLVLHKKNKEKLAINVKDIPLHKTCVKFSHDNCINKFSMQLTLSYVEYFNFRYNQRVLIAYLTKYLISKENKTKPPSIPVLKDLSGKPLNYPINIGGSMIHDDKSSIVRFGVTEIEGLKEKLPTISIYIADIPCIQNIIQTLWTHFKELIPEFKEPMVILPISHNIHSISQPHEDSVLRFPVNNDNNFPFQPSGGSTVQSPPPMNSELMKWFTDEFAKIPTCHGNDCECINKLRDLMIHNTLSRDKNTDYGMANKTGS